MKDSDFSLRDSSTKGKFLLAFQILIHRIVFFFMYFLKLHLYTVYKWK